MDTNANRLADEILQLLKSRRKQIVLKTIGYSMVPTIHQGDEIVLNHIDTSAIRRGDLVTFKVGPSVVTHRVIRRVEEKGRLSFVQKGDNGIRAFALPEDCVIGKVVEIRSGKHVIALDGPVARSIAYMVAVLETLFERPIAYLSERLKRKSSPQRGVVMFLFRGLLHLRSKTIGLVLRPVRLFCRKRR